MRPSFLPLALATSVFLAGCASTHGLAPESQPRDANATLATKQSFGATSDARFPAQAWWKAYGDPQLDALIDEALSGTPSLAAADARVRQAAAQAGLADAARKPTLGASGQYIGLLIPESIAPEGLGGEYQGIFLLGLNFKWSLDLWGAHAAEWRGALDQARAVEVDAQAARLMLASNIARTYIALALAHDAADTANAEAARASNLASLSQQRVKAGIDNQLQLRNAEANVGAAKQQAQAAMQQADLARNALAALLGKGPDRGRAIATPALLQGPAPGVPDVLPSDLLGHRPDVVAARWRVEAAGERIHVAKAAFYPTVNINALVGVAGGHLSDLFDSDNALVNGGPALSLPIFDGGRLRNSLAKSDAEYDLAVADYDQTLVGAVREVADAVQTARALDAQLATIAQARESANAAYSVASQRYKAGLGTQLDVLAAQRPLLQFDQQIDALRAQRLQATVDLQRALGGGLQIAHPIALDANNQASN
ncbi:NodT family RND efflux system outer membrane lipoprotein [Lysobacter dokdonensis DS-58]|uniref:NodT family RND efflux system outer membrane lipoprotein n=1 Tax=Lysobacter dokdonensis DS-58 TaxID=1300345 RepID=A0A0A2WNH5_9GAMM|nr:efflux transporter outer membrane subunit [Lysobacter dokdonensis]KGQ19845.1 NodT family RND efflux system outer membrane lipoprotein [Lysobacter dokdonensis DS-58]